MKKVWSYIWAILRGVFWGIIDGWPNDASYGGEAKSNPWYEPEPATTATSAPPPPSETKSAPPPPKAGAWWPAPAPPSSPPTIKLETDAGSIVSRVTFSGHHQLGIRREERKREEGESRRRRRRSAAPTPPSPVCATDLARVNVVEPETPLPNEPAATLDGGSITAVPTTPSESPRIDRARQVRSRLEDGAARSRQLVTTLATRLSLGIGASPPALPMTGPATT